MDDTRSALHVNLITEPRLPIRRKQAACAFFAQKRRAIMPKNQFQRMIFALLTVIITVHGYVFYSLYVVTEAC